MNDVPTLATIGEVLRVGVVVAFLLLPGLAVTTRLRGLRGSGTAAWLGVAVSLGLAIPLLLAAVLSLLGLGTTVAVWGMGVLSVGSVAVLAAGLRGARRSKGPRRRPSPETMVALAAATLLAILGAQSIRPIPSYSDVPDHLGTVRAIAERGVLEPNDVFYADGDGETPDLRKGFYHVWLAVGVRMSGLDVPTFWYGLRPWLLALAVLGIQPLLCTLFPRAPARIASTVLLPFVVHGNSAWFLDTFAYPHNLGWTPIWAALGLAIEAAGGERGERARRDRMIAAAVIGASLPLLHVFAPVLLLAGIITLPAAFLVLGPRDRVRDAVLVTLVLTGAVALPLAWRLLTTYHPVNPIHLETSEVFYLTDHLTLHAIEPMFRKFSPFVLGLSVLSLLWLWRRDVRSWRRAALVGLTAGPLLVSLNPVMGGLLQPKLGYLFVRFLGVVPFAAVGGALVGDALARAPRSVWGRWLPLAIVLVVVAERARPVLDLTAGARVRADLRVSPERWEEGLRLLEASVPAGATVATDPFTGYGLPAYTGHRILAMLDQHSSPSDPELLDRLHDVAVVLNPYVPLADAIAVLDRTGTRFVLLNQSFEHPRASYFDVRAPRSYALERARFEGDQGPIGGGPFRKLASTPTMALYELLPPDERGMVPEPPSPPGGIDRDRVPELVGNPEPVAFTDAVSLVGVIGIPDEISPGETLAIGVVLRKTAKDPAATPYRLVVRARKVDATDVGEVSALDRLRARIRQDAGGPRVEVIRNRRPLGGAYPLALWPVGTTLVDTVRIRLPQDLEPGTYPVGVYLHEQKLVRNVALRDWLRPGGGIGYVVGETRVISPREGRR